MKSFEELSERELVALTDTEITYYIDRQCAEEGIPLLPPHPPRAPSKQPIEDDLMVYKVAGLMFSDIGEAQRVRDVLLTCSSMGETKYLEVAGSYRYVFKPINGLTDKGIDSSTMLTDGRATKFAQAMAAHQAEVNAYKEAEKHWNKATEGRRRIVDSTSERIHEAEAADRRRQEIGTLYSRYLALANDDHAVAARFLKSAEPDAPEVLPELFPAWAEVEPGPEPVIVAAPRSDEPVVADEIPW